LSLSGSVYNLKETQRCSSPSATLPNNLGELINSRLSY